jgi:excisionase family DNA binding protein
MLTVREAALQAGCGEETVRRWIRAGRLQARRDGPRLLVYREEVDALTRPRALELPAAWRRTWLRQEHDWVARVRRERGGGR